MRFLFTLKLEFMNLLLLILNKTNKIDVWT